MPLIREIHEATGHTYGAEWIAKELRKRGRTVGKDRVEREFTRTESDEARYCG